MPRYKAYSYEQTVMIPIQFDEQILPGSIEETIHYVVDDHIDMHLFEGRFKNEHTGAPAYDPRILLKILLLAYSRGITSSRDIEHLCRENVVFMALSAEAKPDHATIAGFVSTMGSDVEGVFRDVLLICYEMGLLGSERYAIDGCKMSSNASKEWSGSKADYENKKQKIEATIRYLIAQHKQNDKKEEASAKTSTSDNNNAKRIGRLEKKVRKIQEWIDKNEDKTGKRGNIKKSNITDNESCKMPSSHGVIQGYNGIATVDDKHQVVVQAEAYGEGQESVVFADILEKLEHTLQDVEGIPEPLQKRTVLADTGFHSKEIIDMVEQKGIDAYIPDQGFRMRDPRFETARRHKLPVNRTKKLPTHKYFKPSEFKYDEDKKKLICPAGKALYVRNSNYEYKGRKAIAHMARKTDCGACEQRHKCIRKKSTIARQVHIFYDHTGALDAALERMKRKIDSVIGRHIYSMRMKIVEPVFGNIRNNMGLNRFSMRGREKVGVQWKLFGIIHNMGKIARYGYGFT